MLTPGVCICSTPLSRGCSPIIPSPMPGRVCAPGQKAAWGDTPCHGDVFHIIRQCEGLANTLSRLAKGATSRRERLEARFASPGRPGLKDALVTELALARTKPKPEHVKLAPHHPYPHPMAEPRRSGAGRTEPGHAAGVVRLCRR